MERRFDVDAAADVLRSADAVVVGGASGLRREVSRVRIAETPEHLRRAVAHELVVVTIETLLAAGDAGDPIIEHLDGMGAAGIAVRLGESRRLSPAVIAAGDRLGFPVVVLPARVAPSEVTSRVLDALQLSQRRLIDRILGIQERFAPAVAAEAGVAEILARLHATIGYPVVVVDRAGLEPSAVPPSDHVDVAAARATGTRQAVTAGEHDYGEIIALTDGAALDDGQRLALEWASMAIAVHRAHAGAAAAEHERFAATSLEALVAGHAGAVADVVERATSFGWDLSIPRAVLLASVDPPTETRTLRRALDTIAAAARSTLGRDAIVWTRSTAIGALIAPETDTPAERRAIADVLRGELDHRLRTVNVSIGVGRRVDDLLQLSRSYLEAGRAVEVGRWAEGRHVTKVFDELGLERLLSSTPGIDLAEFVEQAIGPLVEHDRRHRSDLVGTLAVWLDTRNMAEAARLVHVHYNTFKNRLERVESILGPVLADPARTLECAVAVYVSRQYDGPWVSAESRIGATGSSGPVAHA